MKTQFITFLLGGLLVATSASSYYGSYSSFESSYEQGKTLCQGSSSCDCDTTGASSSSPVTDAVTASTGQVTGTVSEPSIVHCNVSLVNTFHSFSSKFVGTMYHDMFDKFLKDIQSEILCDITLSDEMKFRRCMDMFMVLCSDQDFYSMIEYENIDGFGCVKDLVTVCQEYNEDDGSTKQALAMNRGTSMLFEALINCSCLSVSEYAYLSSIMAQISAECSSCSEIELGFAYAKAFKAMFDKYPSWKEDFFRVKISDGMSFADVYSSMDTYFTIMNSPSIVGGSVSTCPLLVTLLSIASNSSIDTNTRSQIYQLYQSLEAEFSSVSDYETRLNFLMNATSSFLALEPWMQSFLYGIHISYESNGVSSDCSFYDLLFATFFSSKYDFNIPAAPTTEAPATTQGYLLSCNYGELVCNNNAADGDQSPLIYSLWLAYNGTSWPSAYKQTLKSIIGQCQKMLNGTDSNWQTRANNCFSYLKANPANSAAKMNYIFSTVIYLPSGQMWGRVGDFGACTSSGNMCSSCT